MIRRRFFCTLLVCSLVLAALGLPRAAQATQTAREPISVLVSDAKDLQLLAFWVALGGGYFAREGLDVRVVATDVPTPAALVSGVKAGAPVAILPGSAYERLIADRYPVLLVANLLQNDPLDIVLRHDAANNFEVNSGLTLQRRLALLRGAKLGVTVGDRARLYQLFRAEGLDANLATIVIRKGNELLAEFAANTLDAIYAPPLLTVRALVERDGILYADPAGGEVPAFGERLVEALAVSSDFARTRGGEVEALVRAIGRAEHTLHFEPNAAIEALGRALPDLGPKVTAKVVATYARAVPATPHLEAGQIRREAKFYPVGDDKLDLTGVDLESAVFNGKDYLARSRAGTSGGAAGSRRAGSRMLVVLLGALALALAFLVVVFDQRESRRAGDSDGTT
jgi:ABC-type nitrate/sulfonate/bicarbonate transport system substrate-binding protein